MFFSSRAASSCMLLESRPTISTPLSILSPGFFSTGWEFSFGARIFQKYDRFPSCRVVFSTSHMLSPARIVFPPNVRFNAISYFYFLTVRPPGKYIHKMAKKNITAGKMSRAIAPFHCNTSGASHSCTFFPPMSTFICRRWLRRTGSMHSTIWPLFSATNTSRVIQSVMISTKFSKVKVRHSA